MSKQLNDQITTWLYWCNEYSIYTIVKEKKNRKAEAVSLETLHLQGNSFEGNIPQTLKNLRGLLDIDLLQNNLSGKIPEFLGEFIELKHLNLSHNNLEAERSFIDECQVLRSIRHRNLLKIINAISGVDHQGNDFKDLFINCDIKSSNVLLVGDFGLATFLFEESSTFSTQPLISASLRGSTGYIPPGKRPTDEAFEGGNGIHQFVAMALPNHVKDIVDPSLVSEQDFDEEYQEFECDEKAIRRNYEIEATAKGLMEDCFVSLMQIGVYCSANPPSERMAITVVINKLHATKNSFI
ncbi:Putative LRR receptor-like serine/threonine-protein kinase [Glycine soja]|uniref:Putative LRR receptor-like serine/threonine-protein kinase n=1 Tax=Glycine soja TaxID=3848 RepID=A0A0B2PIE2_GLYSO|nr:Putative LRR receptor-like serine/threonine-protein kinase [Glycine soja]